MVGGAKGMDCQELMEWIILHAGLGREIQCGNPVHAIGRWHGSRERTGASTNMLRSRGRLNGPPEVDVNISWLCGPYRQPAWLQARTHGMAGFLLCSPRAPVGSSASSLYGLNWPSWKTMCGMTLQRSCTICTYLLTSQRSSTEYAPQAGSTGCGGGGSDQIRWTDTSVRCR